MDNWTEAVADDVESCQNGSSNDQPSWAVPKVRMGFAEYRFVVSHRYIKSTHIQASKLLYQLAKAHEEAAQAHSEADLSDEHQSRAEMKTDAVLDAEKGHYKTIQTCWKRIRKHTKSANRVKDQRKKPTVPREHCPRFRAAPKRATVPAPQLRFAAQFSEIPALVPLITPPMQGFSSDSRHVYGPPHAPPHIQDSLHFQYAPQHPNQQLVSQQCLGYGYQAPQTTQMPYENYDWTFQQPSAMGYAPIPEAVHPHFAAINQYDSFAAPMFPTQVPSFDY